MYTWSWFIVPLGAKEITLAHAIGILLTVEAFTGAWRLKVSHEDETKEIQNAKTEIIFGILYLLATATIHYLLKR